MSGIGRIGCGAVVAVGLWSSLAAHAGQPSGRDGITPRGAQASFVNWETPHVHPLAMTPDGQHLLAVNTPDNRLEVFTIGDDRLPVWIGSIPVGLDPVSVRVRGNDEAWVVNHVSDSISIVSLSSFNVIKTVKTLDEPCDVVFAGDDLDAFVSCSQVNKVQVFDTSDLSLAPTVIPIDGEDPRALVVSQDGSEVYVAVFESGNATTVLNGGNLLDSIDHRVVVNDPIGPYGGVNPPPNGPGGTFVPPLHPSNTAPPPVSLIVRKDASGAWLDDNGEDWTDLVSGPLAPRSNRPVGWDMPDRDVAIIDANAKTVTDHAHGLMNICMSMAMNPATGQLAVIGTDATNEIRYEPILNGVFLRVLVGLFDPASPDTTTSIVDLNPHLDYISSTVPASERAKSIGDPRAIVFNGAGTLAYIAGMGSNNVVLIDTAGNRTPDPQVNPAADVSIPVGEGPTGIVLDETRERLYVLNKFASTISTVSTIGNAELAQTPFYDPSPAAIKVGRKHLYDTHLTSGLGITSCASCHVDARMDRLGWDLGAPDQPIDTQGLADQNLGAGILGLAPGFGAPQFLPHHTMKGPMSTQTMQDIIGHEPHHWRGDRFGLEEFNAAFTGLLGDDEMLEDAEMQEFEDFLATIHFPPNPYRNLDNTLPTALELEGHYTTGRFSAEGQPLPTGDAVRGLQLYRTVPLDGFTCVACHTLPTGMGPDMRWVGGQFQPFPQGPMGETHRSLISQDGQTNRTIKIAQLRNMQEKSGFVTTRLESNAGFGYMHDGSVPAVEQFVGLRAFSVSSDQDIADLTALMLAFAGSDLPEGSPLTMNEAPGGESQDAHAAVGEQTTVLDSNSIPAPQLALIGNMLALAEAEEVGLVVRGMVDGEQRGFAYRSSLPGGPIVAMFESDRTGEIVSPGDMINAAAPGGELTWTLVPHGSETRIGIDRDEDGWRDTDERDVCANHADPDSFPGAQGNVDVNADLLVNTADFIAFLNLYNAGNPRADFDFSGLINTADFIAFLNAYNACVR